LSRDAFEVWAPPGREWSQWAKPAPFVGASMDSAPSTGASAELKVGSIKSEPDLCVVLDLPGPEAVRLAVGLARNGIQPVPLINTTTGSGEAISMGEVLSELRRGAGELRAITLAQDALPAFVLDSRRDAPTYVPRPRTYDNRWMVFPQDFPSGNYMAARGIRRAVVITREPKLRDDLRHILRRWQDAGLKIYFETPGDGQKPQEITVEKPSMFKHGWYRVLVAMGFKKNAAGGFGGWIPEPSQSRGYG
jgi:hypothetical protein